MDLIFCAGGNKRFADIAIEAGFFYGSQLPETVYHAPYLVDQDWKEPNRVAYMDALKFWMPPVATVLDWEVTQARPCADANFKETMCWAEEASQYAGAIIIIPKVVGVVHRIPRMVGGKPIILGYSIDTGYGGTKCDLSEFAGRDIHLLGGSPQEQMRIWRELHLPGMRLLPFDDSPRVVSVDGNMAQKQAIRRNRVWQAETPKWVSPHRHWPSLQELDGEKWGKDAPYEAFRRSCKNIMDEWRRLTGC